MVPAQITYTQAHLCAPPRLDASAHALFLDLDGTLLDIAAQPDAVVVDAALRESLVRVKDLLHGALAIISGRPVREIDSLLNLDLAAVAGLHGTHVRDADRRLRVAVAPSERLDPLRRRAGEISASLPGVSFEDKDVAIALHYRAAPEAESEVQLRAAELRALAGEDFELQQGNHVVEIKPKACNKGTALSILMQSAPFAGRIPWMVGDDFTDEHAFEAVNAAGGISVVVGSRRPTLAAYAFSSPHEVRSWLAKLGGTPMRIS